MQKCMNLDQKGENAKKNVEFEMCAFGNFSEKLRIHRKIALFRQNSEHRGSKIQKKGPGTLRKNPMNFG